MSEDLRVPKKAKGNFVWRSQYKNERVRLIVVEGADGFGEPLFEVCFEWLPPMSAETSLQPRVFKKTLPAARQWVDVNHKSALEMPSGAAGWWIVKAS